MEIDYVTLIANVGFPIVAYMMLILRIEKKLDKIVEVLQNGRRE